MVGTGGTLRAKYLDWCSARVSERFLELSPEEIYELARPPRGGVGPIVEGGGDEPRLFSSGSTGRRSEQGPTATAKATATAESYTTMVQRVTEVLLAEMELPTFEEWRRAYEADPKPYDEELLGFWRDRVSDGPA